MKGRLGDGLDELLGRGDYLLAVSVLGGDFRVVSFFGVLLGYLLEVATDASLLAMGLRLDLLLQEGDLLGLRQHFLLDILLIHI